MATRIGINGFGRIGRSVFRILSDRKDIQVVAVNDLFENEQLAYLLKYDTVMGVLHKDVSVKGDFMYVNGDEIAMIDEKDPAKIPWAQFDVDIVIESTGVFRNREPLEKHLAAGAKKVILTVPPKDAIDATIGSHDREKHDADYEDQRGAKAEKLISVPLNCSLNTFSSQHTTLLRSRQLAI